MADMFTRGDAKRFDDSPVAEFNPSADHVVKYPPKAGDICALFNDDSRIGRIVAVVLPNRYVSVVRSVGTDDLPFAVYTGDLVVGLNDLAADVTP